MLRNASVNERKFISVTEQACERHILSEFSSKKKDFFHTQQEDPCNKNMVFEVASSIVGDDLQ